MGTFVSEVSGTHVLLYSIMLCGLVFVLATKSMMLGISVSFPFALIGTGVVMYDLAYAATPAFPRLLNFGQTWMDQTQLVLAVLLMVLIVPHMLLVGLRHAQQRGR